MSKKMGQTLMSALSPITTNAWQQIMKAGGGGIEGFGKAVGKVAKDFGGWQGAKSYWAGSKMGTSGWQNTGKALMENRSARRGVAGMLGGLGVMNAAVGDEGFLGFGKSTVNTAGVLSAGAMAKPKIWGRLDKMGTLGRRSAKAGLWGIAGAYGAHKMGLI